MFGKILLTVILINTTAFAVETVKRNPANTDPTLNLINDFTNDSQKQMDEVDRRNTYCRGNPPGQDDAWCSWVCLDGKWSRMCR